MWYRTGVGIQASISQEDQTSSLYKFEEQLPLPFESALVQLLHFQSKNIKIKLQEGHEDRKIQI